MYSLIRPRSLNPVLKSQWVRTFLTSKQIGLDRFESQKESFSGDKDSVVNSLRNSLSGEKLVYTNDLKIFCHTIDTDEDSILLKEALIRFSEKNQSHIDAYKIGPVIARALVNIDKGDLLRELMNNEITAKHFKTLTSVIISLNDLYKKQKYEEILKIGNEGLAEFLSKDFNRNNYAENLVLIYLASAVKLSTEDAFEKATSCMEIYKNYLQNGPKTAKMKLKALLLYHILCIKCNKYDEAFEALSPIYGDNSLFLNCKAANLARIGRIQEVPKVINEILNSNSRDNQRQRLVLQETIDIINRELEKNPNEEVKKQIDLLDSAVISNASLEETILNMPNAEKITRNFPPGLNRFDNRGRFDGRPRFNRFDNQSRFNDRFDNQSRFDARPRFNRFDNQSRFNDRFDDQDRFSDRRSNNFGNQRFGDEMRKPFRPFQTRFREESEII